MDETTKEFLQLMRDEQSKDHAEVKRRLDVIEQNQHDFQQKVALKSEVELVHQRISEAKAELEAKLETEKKRTTELEKAKSELQGSAKATKFWGTIIAGFLLIAEILVVIFK